MPMKRTRSSRPSMVTSIVSPSRISRDDRVRVRRCSQVAREPQPATTRQPAQDRTAPVATPPFYRQGVAPSPRRVGWILPGPDRACLDRLEVPCPSSSTSASSTRAAATAGRAACRSGARVRSSTAARTAATAARAATSGSSPITTWRRCWRFRDHPHRRADSGVHGKGKDLHGRRGESIEVKVPEGTVVKELYSGEVLAELYPPRRPLPRRRRRARRARQRQVPQQPAASADASPSRASTARSGGSSSSCS